jgi:hypothetical protein
MRKTIINALAALATARRLFTRTNSAEPQGALVARDEVKPPERRQPLKPTPSARQQRRKEAISKRKQERRQRARKSKKRKYASLLLKFFYGALALVASVAGIDAYVASRISVSSSEALNPSDPFSTPFVISNDGYLPIKETLFSCGFRNVSYTAVDIDFSKGVESQYAAPPIPTIGGGEKTTAWCFNPTETGMFGDIEQAEVDIVIRYRPAWLPWGQEKRARFLAVSGKDGKLYWLPKALSE